MGTIKAKCRSTLTSGPQAAFKQLTINGWSDDGNQLMIRWWIARIEQRIRAARSQILANRHQIKNDSKFDLIRFPARNKIQGCKRARINFRVFSFLCFSFVNVRPAKRGYRYTLKVVIFCQVARPLSLYLFSIGERCYLHSHSSYRNSYR